jgi:hypothetical protein
VIAARRDRRRAAAELGPGALTGVLTGAAVQAGAAAVLLALGMLRFDRSASGPTTADRLGGAAELVLVSAVQELAFRGLLQRALAPLGFWPAATLGGAAFVAIHLRRSGETAAGLCGLFLFALLASAGVRRSGTVSWAIGFHVAWNLVQDVVLGLPDGGIQSAPGLLGARADGPAWLTGGGAGPEGGAPTLLLTAAALLVLTREPHRPGGRWGDTKPQQA